MSFEKTVNKLAGLDAFMRREAELITGEVIGTYFGEYVSRIFNEGKASDKTPIGQYSTKPMLVGAKSFMNKTKANAFFSSEKAKNKKNKGDSGWRTIKTEQGFERLKLIEGGYKEFRALNGLQTSEVDLTFRGDLFRSVKLDVKRFAIGFNSILQKAKADYLEKHFKKVIFEVPNSDVEEMHQEFITELRQRYLNYMAS